MNDDITMYRLNAALNVLGRLQHDVNAVEYASGFRPDYRDVFAVHQHLHPLLLALQRIINGVEQPRR